MNNVKTAPLPIRPYWLELLRVWWYVFSSFDVIAVGTYAMDGLFSEGMQEPAYGPPVESWRVFRRGLNISWRMAFVGEGIRLAHDILMQFANRSKAPT